MREGHKNKCDINIRLYSPLRQPGANHLKSTCRANLLDWNGPNNYVIIDSKGTTTTVKTIRSSYLQKARRVDVR